ncbi:hypothetical protein E1A91_A08G018300v1 [Gossypium mustelinum]|uniref:Uncharacterized protein n=1 Tax=Gossypium mustelinum TaxID=34275 RepID=A0A5D2Y3N5_GOSMU|nr:hypothetical protein E1A91_A08G018300v1 [Gossypium mustelinum]
MDSQVLVALALSLVGGLSTSLGALFVILNQAPNLKMLGLLQVMLQDLCKAQNLPGARNSEAQNPNAACLGRAAPASAQPLARLCSAPASTTPIPSDTPTTVGHGHLQSQEAGATTKKNNVKKEK